MAKKPSASSESSVYRITEVIGTSAQSWEDAARNAVETAANTLRDLRVFDPMLADFACPSPLAVLAPTESMVCTGTWRLTQADLDAGQVENTANATAFAPPPASGGNGVPLSADLAESA